MWSLPHSREVQNQMTHLKMWINLISAPLPIWMYHVHWKTSCDHLLHLDSPNHSSEPQDTPHVESVEIEFIDESEEPLEIRKPSPTDVFSSYHEYDLFLLNQEIYIPSDNLNSQNTHVCENLDDILIHATNLSHTFALPQSMAQYNCEYLKHTDAPSTNCYSSFK